MLCFTASAVTPEIQALYLRTAIMLHEHKLYSYFYFNEAYGQAPRRPPAPESMLTDCRNTNHTILLVEDPAACTLIGFSSLSLILRCEAFSILL